MKPMILTLWKEFEELDGPIIRAPGRHFPIIIATRIRVTTNNYLSFSTSYCSAITVAPFLQQAMHLDFWYHSHALAIDKLIDNGSYTDPRVLLPPVANNRILRISAALQQRTTTAWIRGIIEISFRPQKLFYMACPQCHQPNSFAGTSIVQCEYCQANIELLPRACITIFIADSSGSLAATAMGTEAENLINYSTAELHYLYEQKIDLASYLMRTLQKKDKTVLR
ncbi:replication protein A 70 kDa DNA-binding subunit D isoform X1 [Coffea arabica]|uniref:Replication protein A 70 kDa DNA-binding subunit D isoform X1 n=1 Tax=Coffea arabica TaxID=13443 RepID=A0A6P6TLV7_COFAR|nr:replication protein A 70 kDa DNA-binding subunit D-like isoform X1 [Coffea arabica]XP_027079481.1 replication protein A 70 kDa DNA-binding subunit D-like isoform X1 [Coffea arabica]XP_027079482.1 replication protein A 70 kDa DNA-binding subunit D-like isoform X1 [Coffea arabica]XP_027079483.1 replication protein A 70 kDa DNA-binding subunit D-like isoform X1 [Coffea arabica]XP_027079484.1 replication protein A 70 kDa DNA-binding subunit D-like isoform X1 [Coffea arabica]XP_027079485.1 repli